MADEQSKWNRKPFRIHFAERELEDLRARIRSSRLPLIKSDEDWALGTDGAYLRSLLHYWCEEYDWRRSFHSAGAAECFAENISAFMSMKWTNKPDLLFP